jgi:hypothetical protein
MSDTDTVTVRLVGGPVDGGTLPVPWSAVHSDPAPGFSFIPEDGSGAPDGYSRVLYTADPGGPPDVWRWRYWDY